MRLLLINANTSTAMTDRVVAAARGLAAPDTEVAGVTGRFGAAVIATRSAYAIAGHAALDCYAEHGAGFDAVVLACFGDPGLLALKELAAVPVVGMAEAGCHFAAQLAPRFGIVTGGERWRPMLTEYVDSLGLGDRLSGVRTLRADGGQIAADPAAAEQAVLEAARLCIEEDGAGLVILGGAGMVGMVERVAPHLPVPVIDGLTPAVKWAEAAVLSGARKAETGALAFPGPLASTGLSPALAALLAQRGIVS